MPLVSLGGTPHLPVALPVSLLAPLALPPPLPHSSLRGSGPGSATESATGQRRLRLQQPVGLGLAVRLAELEVRRHEVAALRDAAEVHEGVVHDLLLVSARCPGLLDRELRVANLALEASDVRVDL